MTITAMAITASSVHLDVKHWVLTSDTYNVVSSGARPVVTTVPYSNCHRSHDTDAHNEMVNYRDVRMVCSYVEDFEHTQRDCWIYKENKNLTPNK